MKNISPFRVQNPLTMQWVLVSPQRSIRPWNGKLESPQEAQMPIYDQDCFLCPGNTRSSGQANPNYPSTYVFENDFPALLPTSNVTTSDHKLFIKTPESGICKVLCYSPKHNLTMANMTSDQIIKAIESWQDQTTTIAENPNIKHIQIFESRGKQVGASSPHPHAQIWAQQHPPLIPSLEIHNQDNYYKQHDSVLLLDYLKQELTYSQRIVHLNDSFAIVVPFWAIWPYETMIIPRHKVSYINQLSAKQVTDLANSLSTITKAYAKLFDRPLYGAPYTMGVHQAEIASLAAESYQLHIHIEPPLLDAYRQKIMGGYERFCEPQRDFTAEVAAEKLRSIISL